MSEWKRAFPGAGRLFGCFGRKILFVGEARGCAKNSFKPLSRRKAGLYREGKLSGLKGVAYAYEVTFFESLYLTEFSAPRFASFTASSNLPERPPSLPEKRKALWGGRERERDQEKSNV
ncbi:hypothetical protein B9G55_10900 [Saccharibacillus sp. O16]|nr:hypothetical protein B9G55_10900 [Saccharibacillus sp. O16]